MAYSRNSQVGVAGSYAAMHGRDKFVQQQQPDLLQMYGIPQTGLSAYGQTLPRLTPSMAQLQQLPWMQPVYPPQSAMLPLTGPMLPQLSPTNYNNQQQQQQQQAALFSAMQQLYLPQMLYLQQQQPSQQNMQLPPVQYNIPQFARQQRPTSPQYDPNPHMVNQQEQVDYSTDEVRPERTLANAKSSVLALTNSNMQQRQRHRQAKELSTRSALVQTTQQRYVSESRPVQEQQMGTNAADEFRAIRQRDKNTRLGGLGFDVSSPAWQLTHGRKSKQTEYAESVRRRLYEHHQEELFRHRYPQ